MVIYEVNVDVEPDVAAAFRAWLDGHVREIVALPGFCGAEIFAREEEGEPRSGRWTIHYRLDDRAALDRYFEAHAARLREDGLRRFGSRFMASRRVLLRERSVPADGGSI